MAKTTTAVALAAALADTGRRILLVDGDPQASATLALGFDVSQPYESLYTAMHAALENQAPVLTVITVQGFDLVPSHIDLASMEMELTVTLALREAVLRRVLTTFQGTYDYILIDCPPTLGWLTINALVAVSGVLVPVMPDYLSVAGLTRFWETLVTTVPPQALATTLDQIAEERNWLTRLELQLQERQNREAE